MLPIRTGYSIAWGEDKVNGFVWNSEESHFLRRRSGGQLTYVFSIFILCKAFVIAASLKWHHWTVDSQYWRSDMAGDLEVIKRLEEKIRKRLEERLLRSIMYNSENGYSVDEDGNIIGLNLCDVPLRSFPEEILKLRNLKRLFLWNTQLAELPEGFTELKRLEELVLGRNRLKSFPDQVLGLKKLRFSEHFSGKILKGQKNGRPHERKPSLRRSAATARDHRHQR